MNNNQYTRINEVMVNNRNLDFTNPTNEVVISFPSCGEQNIEFVENFIRDLQQAVELARSITN